MSLLSLRAKNGKLSLRAPKGHRVAALTTPPRDQRKSSVSTTLSLAPKESTVVSAPFEVRGRASLSMLSSRQKVERPCHCFL